MTGFFARTLFLSAITGVALAAALASGGAVAQTAAAQGAARAPLADKPQWTELTRPQQVALEPLRGEWDYLDGMRKQKWLDIANRYASMKSDEQVRVHERMRDWLKLTPEERRLARENYTLSKKIDKGQKSAQWEQYQALPEEEKRKLAADAALKKQVTNLPPKTQPKAVAPIKPAAPLVQPPAPTPPPGNPAPPVPNAK